MEYKLLESIEVKPGTVPMNYYCTDWNAPSIDTVVVIVVIQVVFTAEEVDKRSSLTSHESVHFDFQDQKSKYVSHLKSVNQ